MHFEPDDLTAPGSIISSVLGRSRKMEGPGGEDTGKGPTGKGGGPTILIKEEESRPKSAGRMERAFT